MRTRAAPLATHADPPAAMSGSASSRKQATTIGCLPPAAIRPAIACRSSLAGSCRLPWAIRRMAVCSAGGGIASRTSLKIPRPRRVLAAAVAGDALEVVAGLAAGQVHAVDRDFPRVQPGDRLDGPLGELPVGEQEHG